MRLKIAVYNDLQLPLPAVDGGSVPTLLNILLDENEVHGNFDFYVFSCYSRKAVAAAKKYRYSHFDFSHLGNIIRFITNVKFILKNKLKLPFNLSETGNTNIWKRGGDTT